MQFSFNKKIKNGLKKIFGIKNGVSLKLIVFKIIGKTALLSFFIIYIITGWDPIEIFKKTIRAINGPEINNTRLYSLKCLNENSVDSAWNYIKNAEGKPDIEMDSGEYSSENSAIFSGGIGNLICADFSSAVDNNLLDNKKNKKDDTVDLKTEEQNDSSTSTKNLDWKKLDNSPLLENGASSTKIAQKENEEKLNEQADQLTDADKKNSLNQSENGEVAGVEETILEEKQKDSIIIENPDSSVEKNGQVTIENNQNEADAQPKTEIIINEISPETEINTVPILETSVEIISPDTPSPIVVVGDLPNESNNPADNKSARPSAPQSINHAAPENSENQPNAAESSGAENLSEVSSPAPASESTPTATAPQSEPMAPSETPNSAPSPAPAPVEVSAPAPAAAPASDGSVSFLGNISHFKKIFNKPKLAFKKLLNSVQTALAETLDSELLSYNNLGQFQSAEIYLSASAVCQPKNETPNPTASSTSPTSTDDILNQTATSLDPTQEGKNGNDLIIWYKINNQEASSTNETWYELKEIYLNNLNPYLVEEGGAKYLKIDAPFIKSWADAKNLEIKFEGVGQNANSCEFYLDSVWVDAKYAETEPEDDGSLLEETNLSIDGRSINLSFTDENNSESLIIKSDQKIYSGLTSAVSYFSVTNISDKKERINLQFHFPKEKGNLTSLKEFKGGAWEEVNIAAAPLVKENLLQEIMAKKREKIKDGGMEIKESTDNLNALIGAGKTRIFKAYINYPVNSNGEFFIEAIGDKGGSGFLDPWWNSESSWNYRLPISVYNPNDEALTNYPVQISPLAPEFWENVAENGADIRFVEEDSQIELPYYIESWDLASTTAQIWVKINELPPLATTTLLLYYGNNQAQTVSSGEQVFEFFDDFNDGDFNSWTELTPSQFSIMKRDENLSLLKNSFGAPNGIYQDLQHPLTNFELSLKTNKIASSTNPDIRYGITDSEFIGYNAALTDMAGGGNMCVETRVANTNGSCDIINQTVPQTQTDEWHLLKLKYQNSAFEVAVYDSNQNLLKKATSSYAGFSGPFNKIIISGGDKFLTDDIYLRKLAPKDPIISFDMVEVRPESDLIQKNFQWFVNSASSTPNDPWPRGENNLNQNSSINSAYPVVPGDVLRLRINLNAQNSPASNKNFKLQFGAGADCKNISTWEDVGEPGSTAPWRGFLNSSLNDGEILTTLLLASSTVAESYESQNPFALLNNISVDETGEWDFAIENNEAKSSAHYCFRLAEENGGALGVYENYPSLVTNSAPDIPQPLKPFDFAEINDSTPFLEFKGSDMEGDDLSYEVRWSSDYAFTSPQTRSSEADGGFYNIDQRTDLNPFYPENSIRYQLNEYLENNKTYWWQVRSRDPQGSGQWSEWSEKQSFTINQSVTLPRWLQTTKDQFQKNELLNIAATSSDELILEEGKNYGSVISMPINFSLANGATSWETLVFHDQKNNGKIKYYLDFLDSYNVWKPIPNEDLSGNLDGFTDSPVSLMNLSTSTYNIIRVRAEFESLNESPALSDWEVKWDPNITISGTVYSDEGATPILTEPIVSLAVNGIWAASGTASAVDGTYSFSGIEMPAEGNPIVVFLDDSAHQGTSYNLYSGSGNITSFDIYQDHIITRDDDITPIANSDVGSYDGFNDSDIRVWVTGNNLTASGTHLIYVWENSEYTPGGTVTIEPGEIDVNLGGSLKISAATSIFNAEANDIDVGGSWTNLGSFTKSTGQTVTFTATSSTHTISPGDSHFENVRLESDGAELEAIENIIIDGDLTVATGSLIGTYDITVSGGDVTGDGVLSLTGGTFTLKGAGNFGGAYDWVFYNLTFGDGATSNTTTKTSNNDITIGNTMTVGASHTLTASSSMWELSNSGTPLVINGTLTPQTSLFTFTGSSNTNIPAKTFYDLEINPVSGSPTFTVLTGTLTINNDLYVGDGVATSTLTANTNNPTIDIGGDLYIMPLSEFIAPPSNNLTVEGSWWNYGDFTHNNGNVIFDGDGSENYIYDGVSPFYNIEFNNSSGEWTLLDNASSTNNWTITNAALFRASSTLPWYNNSWQYRKKITIDHDKVEYTFNNFPVLISITDNDIATKASSTGADILFTSGDGVTKLEHEIEFFSTTTKQLIVWVKVPLLSNINNTEIFVYYGNPDAADQQSATVWSAYTGVWHLNQTGTGDNVFTDATGNGYNGGKRSGVTAQVAGKISYGISSDGSNGANVPIKDLYYDTTGQIGGITVCAWFKTSYANGSIVSFDEDSYYQLDMRTKKATWTTTNEDGVTKYMWDGANTNNNKWHYTCAVFSAIADLDSKVYVDGVLKSAKNLYAAGKQLGNGNTRYGFFGAKSQATTYDGTAKPPRYSGSLDEIRITSSILTDEWIETEYNNQNSPSTFIKSVGKEEVDLPDNITLEINGQFTNLIGAANTDWASSTVWMKASTTINTKTSPTEEYFTLKVSNDADVKMWNATSTFYVITEGGSLYSMDHYNTDGSLQIFGDYARTSGIEYWNYATDWDGTNLSGGSERQAIVEVADSSSVTIDGAQLQIIGSPTASTTVWNLGAGPSTFAFNVNNSTLNAQYYFIRNLDTNGLNLTGTTNVTSLNNGDFSLAVEGGTMIKLEPTVINATGALNINACKFSSIYSGYNVTLTDVPTNTWYFPGAFGNWAGDAYDVDPGNYLVWDDSPSLYRPKSQEWKWFTDVEDLTPTVDASATNTTAYYIATGTPLKLRTTINELGGSQGTNVKMRLQYSTYSDFSAQVFDVGEIGSTTALWDYYAGAGADNSGLEALVLSDSTATATHNTSGTSASTYDHAADTPAEWEFTIVNNDAVDNTIYYFRAYTDTYSEEVPTNVGQTYPSILSGAESLSFSISGLPSGTVTEGITTDFDTTSTGVPFGNLDISQTKAGAQRISITTNAINGYQVFVYGRQAMTNDYGNTITPTPGTNEVPLAWPAAQSPSCFGYHTSSHTLSGPSPNRFAQNDTYAKFETTMKEVGYNAGSTTGDNFDLIYRLGITDALQSAGTYQTQVVYIIVPVF